MRDVMNTWWTYLDGLRQDAGTSIDASWASYAPSGQRARYSHHRLGGAGDFDENRRYTLAEIYGRTVR
jgi:hypothetical protein